MDMNSQSCFSASAEEKPEVGPESDALCALLFLGVRGVLWDDGSWRFAGGIGPSLSLSLSLPPPSPRPKRVLKDDVVIQE